MKWSLLITSLLATITGIAQPNFNGGGNDGNSASKIERSYGADMYNQWSYGDGYAAGKLAAPSTFNPFKGGSSDGFAWHNGYSPVTVNMYNGGKNDGYACYNTTATNFNMYAGGTNDGQSASALTPAAAFNMYAGGTNDGFAWHNGYSPVPVNLFTGGSNDGFGNSRLLPAATFNIFAGGNNDGFANSRITPSAAAFNPYKGGSNDGFAWGSSVTPPAVESCGTPVLLQIQWLTNITKHSATFTWPKFNSGATSYTILVRTDGVNGTIVRNIAEPYGSNTTVSVEFTGLTAGRNYCFNLQEHCGPGVSTEPSPHYCFTTLPDDCPAPTTPQHLGSSGSTVSIGWEPGVTTAGVSNYGYEIELTPTGSTATYNFGGNITGTPMSRTVTCLPTGTFFTYKIREQCGVNKYSDYITGTTYTSPGCTAPTDLATTVLNTQNARLSWNSIYTTETNKPYQLSYGVGITSPEAGIYSPVYVIQPANVSGTIRSHNLFAEAGVGNLTWYVREICGMCDTTTWAGPYTITPLACTAPIAANMSVGTVTGTTAVLNWVSVNNNTAAMLEVRNQATGGTTAYEVPATTGYNFAETVSGLSPGTTYNWRVKQYCPNGDSTDFTTWNEFTTPGGGNACAAPTNQGIFVTSGTVLIVKWDSPLYLDGSKRYQIAAGMNITSPNGAPISQTSGYYRTQSPTNPTHFFSSGNTPGFTWYVRDECSAGLWSDWLGPYVMGASKTDETTTSVNEEPAIGNDMKLQLFPNPNNGQQLYITGISTSDATLTMYNMQGSVVLKQALQAGMLNTIDISGIADAVYLCHITTPTLQRSVRLVIHR